MRRGRSSRIEVSGELSRRRRFGAVRSALVLFALAAVVGAAHAGLAEATQRGVPEASQRGVDPFRAMLRPESSQQEPGGVFELTFEVDETARQFNGYEVRLHWNPDVLTLDSVRQGSLMADACPNNFTNLTFTDSTAVYSHVLLCGGVSLDGPGVLSVFTFRAHAAGSTVVDIVSDPNRTFFDDGIYISPAHPTYPRQVELFDATVSVGGVSGAPIGSQSAGFAVRVAPNPVRSDGMIRIVFENVLAAEGAGVVGSSTAAPIAPVSFELADVTGRVVHRRTIDPGEASISWRAVDDDGARLPAGAYFYAVRSQSGFAAGKFVIVR